MAENPGEVGGWAWDQKTPWVDEALILLKSYRLWNDFFHLNHIVVDCPSFSLTHEPASA